MRIEPDDKIIGYPILTIRELMRKRVFDRKGVEAALKIDEAEATRVIGLLSDQFYICPFPRRSTPERPVWQTTPKGTQLANAGTLPSISHAEAESILAAFMERVKQVAVSEDFHYEVQDVVLFGSYLRGAETVNDIDLIVRLRSKTKFSKPYPDLLAVKLAAMPRERIKGPRDLNLALQVETQNYLKSVSPYISLHRADALRLIEKAAQTEKDLNQSSGIVHDTRHQVVYRAPS
jgi:predicted nucleotidyltransferase